MGVMIMSDITDMVTDIITDQKTERILTIQLIENVAMMVKRMLTEESFITEVKRLTKRVSSSLHTLIATIPTAPATRNLTLIQATTIIIIMVTDITMVTTDMTTDMVMDTIITDMITITMITITMITTTMVTTITDMIITIMTMIITIMTMIITDTDTTMATILTLPPLLMVTTTDTDMVTIIMKESLLTPTDMIIIMDIRTVTTMVIITFLATSTRLTLSMAQVGTVSFTVRLPVPSPITLDSSQILESTVTTATQLPSLHGHLINNQQFVSQLMTTVMVIIITVMEDMITVMIIMDMIILTRNIKNTIRNRRKLTKRPKRIKRRRTRPTNEVSSTKLSECPITKSLERLINMIPPK